mgnify:CR=1 FL=1
MGALAESFGMRQGISYRKPVKEELETVLRARSRRSCRAPRIARSDAGSFKVPRPVRRQPQAVRGSTCARR